MSAKEFDVKGFANYPMYLNAKKRPKHFYKMHFDPLFLRRILKPKKPEKLRQDKLKLATLLPTSEMDKVSRNNRLKHRAKHIFPSSAIANKRSFHGVPNRKSDFINSPDYGFLNGFDSEDLTDSTDFGTSNRRSHSKDSSNYAISDGRIDIKDSSNYGRHYSTNLPVDEISNDKAHFSDSPDRISNKRSDFDDSSGLGISNGRSDLSDFKISSEGFDSTSTSGYGISNRGSDSTELFNNGFSYFVLIIPVAVIILGLIIFYLLYQYFVSKRKGGLNQSKKLRSKNSIQQRKELRNKKSEHNEYGGDIEETNLLLQIMKKRRYSTQPPIVNNSSTISTSSGLTLNENGLDTTAYEGDTEEIELLPQTNKKRNQTKQLKIDNKYSTTSTSSDFTLNVNDRGTKEANLLEKSNNVDVYYMALTEPSSFSSDESYESLNDYDNVSFSSSDESYDSAKDCIIDIEA